MIYASASGLDPHISVESANLQVDRICKARNFSEEQENIVKSLIDTLKENRQFGFLGEERINVLKLNIELDEILK
jgi:K+-transporting ATPase ATPase C chain